MSQDEPAIHVSPVRRAFVTFSGMLTITLYFMTVMVVSTVMPQIQGAMAATADEVSWVVTFNLLATAIVTPMTGWLVARFGRKLTMCTCVAGFTLSTLMCGRATSLEELIIWRIAQGAFGAPTLPLNQTITLDIYPRSRHRFVLGLNGVGSVFGPVIGPALAGYLAETYSWRWAFFILVPICIAAFIGLVAAMPRDRPGNSARLDWIGFLSLSIAVGGLQYVLSRGQRLDWFESTEICAFTAVAGLAFYLFLAHSLTTDRPFLELRLLRRRNLVLGYILVSMFGMLAFTPMVLLPTLFRQFADYPDALIGWVVGSRGIGTLVGFAAAMFSDRIDPRASIATGFLIYTVSGLWLMQITLDVSPFEIMANNALQGVATGFVTVPLMVTAFADLEPRYRAEATGVFHLLRNIASSFFISFIVALVVRSTSANYARMVEMVSEYNKGLTMPGVLGAFDPATVPGLFRIAKEVTRQAAMIAYLNAFAWCTVISALAIPFALLIVPSSPSKSASNTPVVPLSRATRSLLRPVGKKCLAAATGMRRPGAWRWRAW